MKIKTKRYTFIFKGKGNYDPIGARSVLIQHGIKYSKITFNVKILNKKYGKIKSN